MGGSHEHYSTTRSSQSNMGNGNDTRSIAAMSNSGTASSTPYPEQNYGVGNKWVKHLYQDRLGNFLGGHYDDVNLSHVLFHERVDSKDNVKLLVWSAPGREKPSFEEAMKQGDKDGWKEAKKGDSFGPSWTNHWWKVSLKIPSGWDKYERVQFEFDPGCEAMIYTTSGTPLQGITGGYGGERRVEFIISPEARKAGKLDIVIESTCNGMFGVPWTGNAIDPPDMNRYFGLASADIVAPNQEAWRLMWDWNTLRQIIDNLPGNSSLQNKALVVANEIMDTFTVEDPESVKKARKVAEKVFGKGWDEKGAKIYEEGPRGVRVWGIGHCHIDTAWLWPYSVTQQKVARSWSTQVDLMERYPEHRFTASSAQQYKWLEQLYPEAFEKVKEKVLDGKFHIIGGSWVENDANMPSGESLSRQFIYGQRYFQSRFNGMRCDTAWLPDSFGLSGQLPQIIREADMKWFFTQKLSWNNVTNFPHTTFNWVGFDGTQVMCHMTPVDTYTAQANLGDVRRGVLGHKNLESTDTALLVFGNGDGGGGPLAPMLESLRRIRAVANESVDTEIPVVSMGDRVDDFFEDVAEKTKGGVTLPNWHGELYLEFHRGTYTSHGIIKKGNRKSEILLREVELITTLASLNGSGYKYPKTKIDDMWEGLLLNQFHDVLPGSAIGMVYDDAENLYNWIAKQSKDLVKEALKVLVPNSFSLPAESSLSRSALQKKGRIVALNTVHAPRREVVPVDLTLDANSGNPSLLKHLRSDIVQVSSDGRTGYVVADNAAGAGFAPVTGLFASNSGARAYESGKNEFVLKNEGIQMKIVKGRIVSLYDTKVGRELIPEGTTAGLQMVEDRPLYWDAWDTEIYDSKSGKPLAFESVKVAESGPAFASLESTIKYDKSTIKVTISISSLPATLQEDSRSSIRFDAEVDWRQRHEFLKFEIPLTIHTQEARYDAAFGNLTRPTHRNTNQDLAKFEVCGHKYADMSEFGYGVALLSESKYGFSAAGNVLRMSLLRSATAPDPEQDQGHHAFSWAIHPHANHFFGSDVPVAAHFFNSPLQLHYMVNADGEEMREREDAMRLTSRHHALFEVVGAPNVILETVKRSDDDDVEKSGNAHVVLRLYEAYGGAAQAKLRISSRLGVSKVTLTNLLEDEKESLQLQAAPSADGRMGASDTIVDLSFRGFQFHTVKLSVDPSVDVSKLEEWIDVLQV